MTSSETPQTMRKSEDLSVLSYGKAPPLLGAYVDPQQASIGVQQQSE